MPPKVDMIDVSHWNGVVDYAKVVSAGVKAVYAKATNGAHNSDNTFATNVSSARQHGLLVGAYHFLLSQQNPNDQAAHFITFIKSFNLDLLPVVDVEWDLKGKKDRWQNVPLASRIAMVGRFCEEVRSRTGKLPVIYTARTWWNPMIGTAKGHKAVKFAECPLWVARYAQTVGALPAAWSSYAIWQFAGEGRISGVKGDADLDSLNVPLETLKASA
ncbi:MAG TPA: glycoside hydrolase family 25 protein [Pyrinomonadaceae bacterium]|jgi:GH25 family lysozyme M1 (1,4-beta-N-acetylmuramidase)